MLLVGSQKGYVVLNLGHCIPLFLHNMNFSGYRMGIKFDENPLAVEQKNYPTKVANAFIVYDLNAGPKVPLNNFELKNWLFDATNIVKK